MMVGLFPDATKDYARAIGERLDGLALVVPTTVDALNRASGRTPCEGADGCGPSNARLPTRHIPDPADVDRLAGMLGGDHQPGAAALMAGSSA
jgi:hypothetical protein